MFQLLHPQIPRSVRRHPQITSWRDRDRTDFRAVRQAGPLELLREKPFIKCLFPLQNHLIAVHAREREFCLSVDLARPLSRPEDMVEEKVMQLIRSYKILGLLRNSGLTGVSNTSKRHFESCSSPVVSAKNRTRCDTSVFGTPQLTPYIDI